MAKPDQDALLDRKISENVENIKKGVSEDAWNKLNDAQKAAVTDIVHANGSLDGFPNLKDAIKEGSAKKMADESPFFTDRATGRRDEDRLQRNFEALSGLSREEARKGLDQVLEKNNPLRNATPPRKPEPPEKPGDGGTGVQKPPSVDPSDSGGEGKPQNLGISTGTDADDLVNVSPEAKAFMSDLLKPGKPIDEIMMKRPQDLTEGEAREIMIARMDAKTHDERERLFKAEKGFFDHFFGNEPIGPDAAGRTMEPKPIRPIPQTPTPIATADSEPLGKGLRRIGRAVVRDAKDDGLASAVKRLQGGLNILGETKAPKDGVAILAKLKVDGVFGPKTRSGLRRAIAASGTPKVEERGFAPLFRDPAKPVRRPTDRLEAVTLQETLNDLGTGHFGGGRFRPLKPDGDIGPKTTDAFSQLAGALGPERLTRRFGKFLGFF